MPWVVATPTGFEPVTSAVTGQRSSHLNYEAIKTEFAYITSGFMPNALKKLLVKKMLNGDSDGFRSHYLQRDRLALFRLSYKTK